MKLSHFALCALVSSTFASAAEVPAVKMRCSGVSNYLPVSVRIVVDTEKGIAGPHGKIAHFEFVENKGSDISLKFSESECEDQTTLRFDQVEWNAFVDGKAKRIDGTLIQSEPDLEMQLRVSCERMS